MIQLDAAETARRLPYAVLVRAIAQAAREVANGDLNAPDRLAVDFNEQATLLCMPAVGADIGIAKIVTIHPEGSRLHVSPAIQGEMIVFDTKTGRRLMLLDGPTVTARRTAAVTLLAIDTLAPNPVRSALLIGTGIQAGAHVEALMEYFGVRSFWIAGREIQRATAFCEILRRRHPRIQVTPVAPSDLESSCSDTELVIALTTSTTPVVPADLPDTTLAIGVGAFRPDMAELPAALLKRRRVVVDHLRGARREAGDLLQAGLDWDAVSELSQQIGRARAGPHLPSIFKSVGHAGWDLAAARVAVMARAAAID